MENGGGVIDGRERDQHVRQAHAGRSLPRDARAEELQGARERHARRERLSRWRQPVSGRGLSVGDALAGPPPDEARSLARGERLEGRAWRNLARPRDAHAAAIATEAPAVKGATQAVADDHPAVAQVRAEVRTVRVTQARDAVAASVDHEVAPEHPRGAHRAAGQDRRGRDRDPALEQTRHRR